MLIWNTIQNVEHFIHSTSVTETDEEHLCEAIEACVEKAISLLEKNIQDDSLYLLFEWNSKQAILSVVVTDSNKTQDSPHSVRCVFPALMNQDNNDYAAAIKFWLNDYLATCTAFFSYSLVAIFHSNTRDKTELL